MRRREFITLLSYAAVVWPLTGLKVEARLDLEIYRKGRKVTERELKHLALSTHDVCPRWSRWRFPAGRLRFPVVCHA